MGLQSQTTENGGFRAVPSQRALLQTGAGGFTIFIGLSMVNLFLLPNFWWGLYHWGARLVGRNWAPFTSWLISW
ncbi:hypothetical protein GOBAR_AA25677 [Gossypium barbadense]|uniref:Uncharacterized protein n=1 Tax=Gossypium barbadense TaxID=3634 RepID=A0A2P5WVB7_GOSBA|nr:hypothetical protein GOBAR_AA25677 [Gossypium barbadense]